MRNYILKRVLQLIPIILGITFLSFALMQTASGDVIDAMYENAGGTASEEALEQKRAELGLDKPFIEQYSNWLFHMMKGDMGTSFVSGQKVFETFISKLPATILLTFTSIVVTFLISIPLGVISAVHHNRFWDYFIRFFSFIGNSLPGFFVSLLLIYLFSVKLKLLPAISGTASVKGAILPTITLAIAMSSKYTRQVRSIVLDELNKDYVIGLRARGVRENIIIYKSVLKSAMITIVTLLSLSIGSLLGGTAIVESIFMWEGVGKLAVDAITMRDYPMIQAYVVWMAIIYVVVNLLTDILYHYIDPRVRLGMED